MFEKRSGRLLEVLKNDELSGFLVTSSSNIFYLTGLSFSNTEREAYVLVTKKHTYVFTDARYSGGITLKDHFSVIEIGRRKPFIKAFKNIVRHEKLERVGFETQHLFFSEYSQMKKEAGDKTALVGCVDHVGHLRTIKDAYEVGLIEQAAQLTDAAFATTLRLLREGTSEYEVSFAIESFVKMHGAELAFAPVVAFGANSAIPHHHVSSKRLEKADKVVLLDLGARVDTYCADLTRVVFTQEPDDELWHVYSSVLKANCEVVEVFDRGSSQKDIKVAALGKAADEVITDAKLPAIPHALGHGVGIDVHEQPVLHAKSDKSICNGMIFSIEPGVYLKGKYGVRIEDLALYQDGSLRIFSQSPRDKLVLSSL